MQRRSSSRARLVVGEECFLSSAQDLPVKRRRLAGAESPSEPPVTADSPASAPEVEASGSPAGATQGRRLAHRPAPLLVPETLLSEAFTEPEAYEQSACAGWFERVRWEERRATARSWLLFLALAADAFVWTLDSASAAAQSRPAVSPWRTSASTAADGAPGLPVRHSLVVALPARRPDGIRAKRTSAAPAGTLQRAVATRMAAHILVSGGWADMCTCTARHPTAVCAPSAPALRSSSS